MKRFLIILLVGVMMMSFCASAYALELPKPLNKLGRGIANIISSPLEIGKQITAEWRAADSKHFAVIGGLVKGVGYTLKRLGSGVIDVVTFPIELKDDFEPLMKPDYVFDK